MTDTPRTERGRPPKPDGEARNKKLEIRLNDAELQLLNQAADQGVSTWAREALVRLAKRIIGKK